MQEIPYGLWFFKALDTESDDKLKNLIKSYDGFNSYLITVDKKLDIFGFFLMNQNNPQ